MSANKAFEQWSSKRGELGEWGIEHEEGCYYHEEKSLVPINECACDCYDKAIFRAGYFAAKGRCVGEKQ